MSSNILQIEGHLHSVHCMRAQGFLYNVPLIFTQHALHNTGVLIWRYDTIVGARAAYCGVKHEIVGASTE